MTFPYYAGESNGRLNLFNTFFIIIQAGAAMLFFCIHSSIFFGLVVFLKRSITGEAENVRQASLALSSLQSLTPVARLLHVCNAFFLSAFHNSNLSLWHRMAGYKIP